MQALHFHLVTTPRGFDGTSAVEARTASWGGEGLVKWPKQEQGSKCSAEPHFFQLKTHLDSENCVLATSGETKSGKLLLSWRDERPRTVAPRAPAGSRDRTATRRGELGGRGSPTTALQALPSGGGQRRRHRRACAPRPSSSLQLTVEDKHHCAGPHTASRGKVPGSSAVTSARVT